MKLTKSLRFAIVKQFKDGSSMEYIATLYGFKIVQVEGVVRDWMKERDGQVQEILAQSGT